ncbi:sugar nucleotide-binding protein [Zobellia galactanivorans]|uniref:dTDP-4-dehydrorhamnose reductase n=1 Tax=Zobellia galactanivorans (strain DSM 12802 / CCUG 47099 / CIP 106680 / NCIMB 13871 / Dsij) TaxID=63186 RepID=G0L9G0_ZOBGA|nr:sugar nucleotide-binding protein [Zobellia galactanivorans]MBU3027012.1 sugar nucleotide-binding protein [Zobellia galactanivorans]MDO6810274.1 sugar nucleotide-binding protein [Zobellia galactanivorans]CAZ94548.1 RmlD substrate binding domain family protein [Zobellia galactanivorans]
MDDGSKKILILGASGFLGNAIYKELCNYFDTYGTYNSARRSFEGNKQFFKYNMEEDDVHEILEKVGPKVIVSAVRGNFASQIVAHRHLVEYVKENDCCLYFLSSANVFDAYSKYPSYEHDKTLSESVYGRLKIKIENMLLRLPQKKMGILRIPMVFGNSSPRVKDIKKYIWDNAPVEVFPNLVLNVTNDDKLTQQIHYLINRNKRGIFHLGSNDLVHHEDFTKEIVERIGDFTPIYKRVFTTNDERYLAVLPRDNKLPKNLQFSYQDIIDHHVMR